MNLDTMLRETTPVDLPPLNHERLQRAGRRRRAATRLAGGSAAIAVLAAGGSVIVNLPAVQPDTPFLGEVAPLDQPTGPGTEEDASGSAHTPSAEPTGDAKPEPDGAILATYADLTHAAALSALRGTLAQTPQRPVDLTAITTYEAPEGDRVERLRGDETALDFPVRTVLDTDFDPDAGFETPALQPTWDQRSAELALDALAHGWTFTGVDVDALGRTVLVFQSETSQQYVQVDPGSGYTSGIVIGAGEWADGDVTDTPDEGPSDPTS